MTVEKSDVELNINKTKKRKSLAKIYNTFTTFKTIVIKFKFETFV